ncbi:MAG: 7-cyano-7-deazaguanine synthase QueC [Selenomonadaceae bacterium]|nr:7-cyano-7-deazaguanine synthase QueC [Selenomonadaceae bacterium]
MITAVVLLSGGLDSATCLAMAVCEHGSENVAALSIFYGQRHAEELNAARAVAKFYNVAHYELDASEIFRNSDSALLNTSTDALEKGSYAAQIEKNNSPRVATYVPFRNGLMISMAASFADSLGDEIELFVGMHADDAKGNTAYADCSTPFVAAMNAAVKIGTYGKIRLNAPFLCQTKADVVKVGLALGVPYHLTRSCYERGDKPCGKCATCIDRARAFELNGVKDPALS